MATPREKNFDEQVVPGAKRAIAYLDTKLSHIPQKVWQATVRRGGKVISVLQAVADSKTLGQQNAASIAKLSAKVDGLVGAITALNKGEPFDQAKLIAGIEEATTRGVTAAIGSVTRGEVTVVTIKDEVHA